MDETTPGSKCYFCDQFLPIDWTITFFRVNGQSQYACVDSHNKEIREIYLREKEQKTSNKQ